MTRDYDTQLLESVAVRRRRLRDALMFGPQRTRRTFDENVAKVIAGVCVTAVLCAGTVGCSFLQSFFRKQERQKAEASQITAPDGGTAQVPADWVGTQVSFQRLRAALKTAQVPDTLYLLPGQRRPARITSYYVITKGKDNFTGGLVEFEQGRIAAEFTSEDAASRWLYGELVVKETRPYVLTPADLPKGQALEKDARSKISSLGGSGITYAVPQGQLVDHFGQESGSVLFPFGAPLASRGLPPAARTAGYAPYRVAKTFNVTASISAPTTQSPGGGVRFTINAGLFPRPPQLPTIRWLLRNGYLQRVAGATAPR